MFGRFICTAEIPLKDHGENVYGSDMGVAMNPALGGDREFEAPLPLYAFIASCFSSLLDVTLLTRR
jgi:hypothetical protein